MESNSKNMIKKSEYRLSTYSGYGALHSIHLTKIASTQFR